MIVTKDVERRISMSNNWRELQLTCNQRKMDVDDSNWNINSLTAQIKKLKATRDEYKAFKSPLAQKRVRECEAEIAKKEKELAACQAEHSGMVQKFHKAESELNFATDPTNFVEAEIESLVKEFRTSIKSNEDYLANCRSHVFSVYIDFEIPCFQIINGGHGVTGSRWPSTLRKEITFNEVYHEESWGDERPYLKCRKYPVYSPKLQAILKHVQNECIRRLIVEFDKDPNFYCQRRDEESFYIKLR